MKKNKYNLTIIGHLKATHQNEGLIYFSQKVKKKNLWKLIFGIN